ncbi:MAG: mandelate racemase/muconate lactonizing protein [Acidobacteria bacterium]|nr:mandelate racemase/muconate lactonizing protein [Acidobacteriota bacterium]
MRISAITARPVTLDVNPDIFIQSSLGKHRKSPYVLVILETHGGVTGFGEATVMPRWSGETQHSAVAAIEEILAPPLTGLDVCDINEALAIMDREIHANEFTKAAVEMAMWDAWGKSLNTPVWKLLGGQRRDLSIPLKISIGAFPPAEAARRVMVAKDRGFKACKVKVGLDVRGDLERVAAVRDAVGPDFPVGVDANGGWSESQAVQAIPGLERLRVNMIEQPLARWDFRGSARLRNLTPIPVMIDEGIFTVHQAMEAIRAGACDIISIYPGKNGGIRKSVQIAEMAHAAGIECVIGSNLELDLATSAMLQVAVSIPNLSARVNHDIIGPFYYLERITDPLIRIEDGVAWVPEGPGLGVTLL